MGKSKKLPIRSTLYFKGFMLAFLNLVTRIVQKLHRWQFKDLIPFENIAPR
jgi:hypothetical protein